LIQIPPLSRQIGRCSPVLTRGFGTFRGVPTIVFFDFSHATRRRHILDILEHAKTDYNTPTHLRNERDHPRLAGNPENVVEKVEFWSKSRLPAPLGYQVGR